MPATEIDESGAELDCKDIDLYLDNKKVLGLAEMMNYVGVINGDKNVLSKLSPRRLITRRLTVTLLSFRAMTSTHTLPQECIPTTSVPPLKMPLKS